MNFQLIYVTLKRSNRVRHLHFIRSPVAIDIHCTLSSHHLHYHTNPKTAFGIRSVSFVLAKPYPSIPAFFHNIKAG
jgi:hypothetical protein